MFDPNLQKEKAQEAIGSPTEGVVLRTSKEKELIDLCSQANDLRNLCFSNEDNYHENICQFQNLLREFLMHLGLSEPFKFLHENFDVYKNAGSLQRYYANSIYQVTCAFLTENLSNAMAQSNDVQTLIQITPRGVLMDIHQGQNGFDSNFLSKVKNKSVEVLNLLNQGIPIQVIVLQMRDSLRKTIGYVPQGMDPSNGLPYRGNGIGNILVNDFFRMNFISDALGNSTLSVHTLQQLQYADRLHNGDRSVINALFGPSNVAINREALDELFGGDFDF